MNTGQKLQINRQNMLVMFHNNLFKKRKSYQMYDSLQVYVFNEKK